MRKYKKVYLDAFGYSEQDFIPCELSGSQAVDIHHIVNREDRIENLMALTRENHMKYGEIKSKMVYLLERHRVVLKTHKVPFDNEWFNRWIHHYKHMT